MRFILRFWRWLREFFWPPRPVLPVASAPAQAVLPLPSPSPSPVSAPQAEPTYVMIPVGEDAFFGTKKTRDGIVL